MLLAADHVQVVSSKTHHRRRTISPHSNRVNTGDSFAFFTESCQANFLLNLGVLARRASNKKYIGLSRLLINIRSIDDDMNSTFLSVYFVSRSGELSEIFNETRKVIHRYQLTSQLCTRISRLVVWRGEEGLPGWNLKSFVKEYRINQYKAELLCFAFKNTASHPTCCALVTRLTSYVSVCCDDPVLLQQCFVKLDFPRRLISGTNGILNVCKLLQGSTWLWNRSSRDIVVY
jgi:hypothetical protein